MTPFSFYRTAEQYFRIHPCSQNKIDQHELSAYITQQTNQYLIKAKPVLASTLLIIVHSTHLGGIYRTDCNIAPVTQHQVTTECVEKSIPELHHFAEADAAGSRASAINGDLPQDGPYYGQLAARTMLSQPDSAARLTKVFKGQARLSIQVASNARMESNGASSISPKCDCIHVTPAKIEWLNKPISSTLLGR